MPSQAGEPLPEMASNPAQPSTSADTPMAPNSPGRSRLPVVLVVLAAMGAVAILAAAWVLQQKGLLGHKVVFQKSQRSRPCPQGRPTPAYHRNPNPPRPLPRLFRCRHSDTSDTSNAHADSCREAHTSPNAASLAISSATIIATAHHRDQSCAPCSSGRESRQQVERAEVGSSTSSSLS